MELSRSFAQVADNLSKRLLVTTDSEQALQAALDVAVAAVNASGGTAFLHDSDANVLRFFHAVGPADKRGRTRVSFDLVGSELNVDEGIAGDVFSTGIARLTANAETDPDHSNRIDEEFGYDTETLATVPLYDVSSKILGVVQLVNKRDGKFTEEDIDTVLGVLAMTACFNEVRKQAQQSS